MKLKTYWYIATTLLLLDEITTIIGLKMGLTEANPFYLFIGFTLLLKTFILIGLYKNLDKNYITIKKISFTMLFIFYSVVVINNIILIGGFI